jgi:hypothetical protein
VIGSTVAVLASPLALGTASAAVPALTFDGGQQVQSATPGSTTHITGTTSNFTAAPTVTESVNGADSLTQACSTAPGTFDCVVHNTHAGSSDTVVITAVNGAESASGTATINFPAPAAPDTSVTVTAVHNPSQPTGGSATLDVTYLPTPAAGQNAPRIEYTITGPDASVPANAGTPCVTSLNGTATCTVSNTHGVGTDHVTVFADNNADNKVDATPAPGDVAAADQAVVFSGAVFTLTISPKTVNTPTGNCVLYTATASDANGLPAGGALVTVTVTESTATNPGATPISTFDAQCHGAALSGANTMVTGSGPYAITYNGTTVIGGGGTATFGIASSAASVGSGAVKVQSGGSADQATVTWTTGGSTAVASLTATPSTQTNYVNTSQFFNVVARDATGNGLAGVVVNVQSTSGPATSILTCPTTTQTGTAHCEIKSANAGTNNLQFWVNNPDITPQTPGPDPGEQTATATAVFNALPAVSQANSGLTCVQQLVAGGDKGTAQGSCTVPVTTTSVPLTAIVKDASGKSLSQVVVNFYADAGTVLGGKSVAANTLLGTATTDETGRATLSLANATPANNDTAKVIATVGNVQTGAATVSWKTPVASSLALTPSLVSVTKGGNVSIAAQITDQFGTPAAGVRSLKYSVTGRNTKTLVPLTTDSSGAATIGYTDATTAATPTQDNIVVSDVTPGDSIADANATVSYINGSTTAASVVVDTSGLITHNLDSTCAAANHPAATNVAIGATTEVCAVVKNGSSPGESLAGKLVTFTVTSGQVGPHGGITGTSTATYDARTDLGGVAFVDVWSTKSGAQTVTATVDSVTGSSTVTYKAPTADQARNVKIAPSPATVEPGAQQKLTATVTDRFGNPVQSVNVVFTQSGPGNIGGTSSATVQTAADGTAAVTLSTSSSDSGSGSVTASITPTAPATNQCGQVAGNPSGATAGNCTVNATYTVVKSATPTSLALQSAGARKVGRQELIAATVTNSDGTPSVNQVVRFTISGANSASGSGVTSAKGVAFFAYTPTHAGTDHASAYDDVDNSSTAGAGEPTGKLSVSIGSGKKEHPRLRLTTHHGKVVMHVTSHPRLSHAKVTYYVKHLGRFHKLGKNHTGAGGKAHKAFKKRLGVKFTFRAKVSGKHGVKSGHSKAKSIRVKG